MKTKLEIKGMTCSHCTSAVTKALEVVPGVETVISVDKDINEAIVEGSADPQNLIEAVTSQGYQARLL